MYRLVKICALLTAVLLTVLAAAACTPDKPNPTEPDYTYKTQDPSEPYTGASETAETFEVDPSWQQNYIAEYRYYDRAKQVDSVTIREARCDIAFLASYPLSGNLIYYTANSEGLDCYTVVPSERQYVHSVLKDKHIAGLSSTLMKLTAVSGDMPTYSNVMFMGEETVGGRACKKYIQRAYENGALTETVYVWVEQQFGFAMKCEDYNASDELQTYWEVLSFKTGGVTVSDFGIDLSKYHFLED